MRLYKDLFVGSSVRQRRYQIIWGLKHHKLQRDVYVVTLASSLQNLMDIFPAAFLLQPYYRKEDFLVLGIAGSKQEAMELARQIVEKMYQETGNFRIREFLQ